METNILEESVLQHSRGTKSKSTYAEVASKSEKEKCKVLNFRAKSIISKAVLEKTPRGVR